MEVSLPSSEWVSISHSLEQHHALFYQCWQMGRPCFTDLVDTAAVRFKRSGGEYLDFLFNPEFWQRLTPYERLFVIAHECLHVILNHGIRTIDAEDEDKTNKRLDIVVNHMLVNNFGFDRNLIHNWRDLCWVDTIFEDHPGLSKIPTDGSFEYYMTLTDHGGTKCITLDDHSALPDDWQRVIDKIGKKLSADELASLKDLVGRHGQETGRWSFFKPEPPKKNKKWETIIENWSKIYLRSVDRHQEQWLRPNRRFRFTQSKLLLPSEQEETQLEGDRVEVYFFLDTSGSCYHLKERFFKAAQSLSEDRFAIRLFCFDTVVQETELKGQKIYGGGGTYFHIIEEKISEIMKERNVSYPEAVFIITDGDGTPVLPRMPERWHWFLTSTRKTKFIPGPSKTYNLEDYE